VRGIEAFLRSDAYRAPQPFENFAEMSPRWHKSDNWRIAREVRRDELVGTDLGEFLEEFAATLGRPPNAA
jgi:hypothetical protein